MEMAGPGDSPREEITSLVINAHVTVVLVDAKSQPVRIGGDNFFLLNVDFRQAGGKLTVTARKKRNLRKRGVIYIPAGSLRHIEINSSALVKSAGTLHSRELDVVLNGECRVEITTAGRLNILNGPFHDVRYRKRKMERSDTAMITKNELRQFTK